VKIEFGKNHGEGRENSNDYSEFNRAKPLKFSQGTVKFD